MTHRSSEGTRDNGTTSGLRRRRPARLLLAAAGLATLASVATVAGVSAVDCTTSTRYGWFCPGTGTGTGTGGTGPGGTAWPMPSWPMPGPGVPVAPVPKVTAPVPVPPVPVPAINVPAVATPVLPAAPQSVPDAARRLLELVNLERQSAGLGPLTARDDVTAVASAHSLRMALAGDIFHNRIYFSSATRKLLKTAFRGENVAYNSSIEVAHSRLMRSAGHRVNLLNRRFSVVGIAVVQAPDGRYFITEDFLQPTRPARRR